MTSSLMKICSLIIVTAIPVFFAVLLGNATISCAADGLGWLSIIPGVGCLIYVGLSAFCGTFLFQVIRSTNKDKTP